MCYPNCWGHEHLSLQNKYLEQKSVKSAIIISTNKHQPVSYAYEWEVYMRLTQYSTRTKINL